MTLQLAADQRIALYRLHRHPACVDLVMFGRFYRCRGEYVDLLFEFIRQFNVNPRHFRRRNNFVEHRSKFGYVARIGGVYTEYRNAKMLGQMV